MRIAATNITCCCHAIIINCNLKQINKFNFSQTLFTHGQKFYRPIKNYGKIVIPIGEHCEVSPRETKNGVGVMAENMMWSDDL